MQDEEIYMLSEITKALVIKYCLLKNMLQSELEIFPKTWKGLAGF